MIKVITTVYNAENYIEKCINSVLEQDFYNWEMYIVDDGSTDKTVEKINNYNNNKIFKNFKEKNERAALRNQYHTIHECMADDDDIIIMLDGDDWLASSDVFSYINNLYNENKNLLITYGQFLPSNNAYKNICVPLEDVYSYRESEKWVTSHLRTFKYKIFKNIKKEDLTDDDGDFYKSASDVALMLPLLEMAGNDRYLCIDKVLYIYNNENPINDMKVRENEQLTFANKIKNKTKYSRLIF